MTAKNAVHFDIVGIDRKRHRGSNFRLFDRKVDMNNPMNYDLVSAADAGFGGGTSPAQPEERPTA